MKKIGVETKKIRHIYREHHFYSQSTRALLFLFLLIKLLNTTYKKDGIPRIRWLKQSLNATPIGHFEHHILCIIVWEGFEQYALALGNSQIDSGEVHFEVETWIERSTVYTATAHRIYAVGFSLVSAFAYSIVWASPNVPQHLYIVNDIRVLFHSLA